jgi:hypothetical protein
MTPTRARLAIAVAVLARVACLVLAPTRSYGPDHRMSMSWAAWARAHGPHRLLDCPAGLPVVERTRDRTTGALGERVVLTPRPFNYPPLSALVLWVQGALWARLDPVIVTRPVPGELLARAAAPVAVSRRLETSAARIAHAAPSLVADGLLAWGVGALAGALAGPAATWPAALLTLLLPPVFLDSAFWNQTEAWVASLLVASLLALVRARPGIAGALFGLALATKPQAVLLGPTLACAALAHRDGPGRAALRLAGGAALAILGVLLPFALASSPDTAAAWEWIRRSYGVNLADRDYARTTLMAFNVWWLDWAASAFSRDALDPSALRLGLSKDGWGLVGFVACVSLAARTAVRVRPRAAAAWVASAYVVALSAFVLLTRVHERYVYFCLPFGVALAVWRPRTWGPPLAALAVAGTAEMVWFLWWTPAAPAARSLATGCACLAVGALGWSLVAVSRQAQEPPTVDTPRSR